MLLLDPRRKGRRNFSSVWVCMMMVVLAAAWTVQGATESLYPRSSSCTETNLTLRCNATLRKSYTLDDFKWKDIEKVIIYNSGKELMLKAPLCNDKKQEVEVHNSAKVTTQQGGNGCWQQLVLLECKNVRITDGVDLVRMIGSHGDEINLPRVRQFDLKNSTVKQVSVEVTNEKSTIEYSQIDVVKKLVINGSFQFSVEQSMLMQVEGFVYDSPKTATFNIVRLGSVVSGGFLVQDGKVIIQDSQIDKIEAGGLLVMSRAELVLKNTVLYSITYNSIVASEGGTVSFDNVTVAGEAEIFFTLKGATMNLLPLALLGQFHHSTPLGWVFLYVFIGLAFGIAAGMSVTYFGFRKRGNFKNEADGTGLIPREQPIPLSQSVQSHLNNNNNKNTIAPPERPLPNPPKPVTKLPPQNDELYVEYTDVSPLQAPSGVAPRPLVPVPNASSSSMGSKMPIGGPNFATLRPNIPNKPKGAEKKDDRDNLPPPPLPDESDELYEELAAPVIHNPLPPLPTNKPKGPPVKKYPPPTAPIRKY